MGPEKSAHANRTRPASILTEPRKHSAPLGRSELKCHALCCYPRGSMLSGYVLTWILLCFLYRLRLVASVMCISIFTFRASEIFQQCFRYQCLLAALCNQSVCDHSNGFLQIFYCRALLYIIMGAFIVRVVAGIHSLSPVVFLIVRRFRNVFIRIYRTNACVWLFVVSQRCNIYKSSTSDDITFSKSVEKGKELIMSLEGLWFSASSNNSSGLCH